MTNSDGAEQVAGAVNRAHALAAAARHGLHEQRIADRIAERLNLRARGIRGDWIFSARNKRNARAFRRSARRRLAAHQCDRFRRGTDERQARIARGRREVFVLREKPVAGMHRIGAGFSRGIDDAIDAEVAFARRARPDGVRLVCEPHVQRRAVAFGVHRHRRQPHLATRADDADSNFAAVRDQNLFHSSCV